MNRSTPVAADTDEMGGTLVTMTSADPMLYRQISTLECKIVDDGFVFYDEEESRVIYLNLTAAAIFEICDEPMEIPAIGRVLRANGAPSIDDDAVLECLSRLIELRLIAGAS